MSLCLNFDNLHLAYFWEKIILKISEWKRAVKKNLSNKRFELIMEKSSVINGT